MKFEPVIRFLATSDVHYKYGIEKEPERFERGMRLAYEYANNSSYKNIDALYVVGDFANSGSVKEMLRFRQSLRNVILPETEIVLTLASHEFSDAGEAKAVERLEDIFSQKPDNHKIIKGFHFISLSTEQGCRIKEAKKTWLKEQLEAAVKDDFRKPIFCFQHPHLSDTVYGSINWGEDDIIDILMDYPQAVDFSGHSHAPINDPRSVHQKYFSSFGTGSFSYFELDEFDKMYGTVPPDAAECAQFLIVEADAQNRVRVYPFDVLSGKFFNDGWLISNPAEPDSFIYTDERYRNSEKPYFEENNIPDVFCKKSKISISFKQAKSETERVNSYTVVLRSASDRHIIAQKNISSSYYLYNMPEKAALEFEFNAPAGEYIAEITANGFWHNKSDKLIKAFTVQE